MLSQLLILKPFQAISQHLLTTEAFGIIHRQLQQVNIFVCGRRPKTKELLELLFLFYFMSFFNGLTIGFFRKPKVLINFFYGIKIYLTMVDTISIDMDYQSFGRKWCRTRSAQAVIYFDTALALNDFNFFTYNWDEHLIHLLLLIPTQSIHRISAAGIRQKAVTLL